MPGKANKDLQDKSIKKMPRVLWQRFVGRCKTKGMTVTEGMIQAINMFLEDKNVSE